MINSDGEQEIIILESKITDLKSGFVNVREVERILDEAIENLCRLNVIYSKSDANERREIIGSMYPEKFTFEDLQHRTALVSDPYQVIYLVFNYL